MPVGGPSEGSVWRAVEIWTRAGREVGTTVEEMRTQIRLFAAMCCRHCLAGQLHRTRHG
jgi:hypothetical protein